MIALEYFNGKEWIFVDKWYTEEIAWATLGSDNLNYRTIDENGKVLTDKQLKPKIMAETKVFPDSKQIESASYTKETKTLIVVFKSNRARYSYANVPEDVWEKMKKADSVGAFLNAEIKGKYPYIKLD